MLNRKLDALQIFWGTTGRPNFNDAKYFGFDFPNMGVYLNELQKFLGVEDVNEHILNEINQIIQENNYKQNYIKVTEYPIEKYPLKSLHKFGYGSKPTLTVTYKDDPSFECPYEDEYGDCYFYEYIGPILNEVRRHLKSKYGFIGFNVSGNIIQ